VENLVEDTAHNNRHKPLLVEDLHNFIHLYALCYPAPAFTSLRTGKHKAPIRPAFVVNTSAGCACHHRCLQFKKMTLYDYIFKLTKTKRVKKFASDFPKFELYFPDGWRQMRLKEPYAFYHEQSHSGLTIYFYRNNAKTRKAYTELLHDTYGLQTTEEDFENRFNVPESFIKLIIDSDREYSERVLKLIKKHEILIDICLVGNPRDKIRTIELFSAWEREIKKL
jgi:hypothetical protein